MAKLSDERNNRVFLSLGSNQGNRFENLKQACVNLEGRVGLIKSISHIYESEAWGDQNLLPFYNLVLEIFTDLNSVSLLKTIQEIERILGRKIKTKLGYENRIIDIDILWFNNELIVLKDLVIPHLELNNRRFVLEPFNEIAPELTVGNNGKTILELNKACLDKGKVLKVSLLKYQV